LTDGILRSSRLINIRAVSVNWSPRAACVKRVVVLVPASPLPFARAIFAVVAHHCQLLSFSLVIESFFPLSFLAIITRNHSLRWDRRVLLLFIIIIVLLTLDTGLGSLILWKAVFIEFRSPHLNIVFIQWAFIRVVLGYQLSILLFMTFSLSYRVILVFSSTG
jgi:hypothetical protein